MENFILLVLSVTSVFMKAPVESEKKPLGQGKLRKYKRMARIICIIETCIIVTAAALGVKQIYLYYAVAGMVTTAILLLCGKAVNGNDSVLELEGGVINE